MSPHDFGRDRPTKPRPKPRPISHYENNGQHAESWGIINNFGAPWLQDRPRFESLPPDLGEGSNILSSKRPRPFRNESQFVDVHLSASPREQSPQRNDPIDEVRPRRGEQSPQRNEPEFVEEAHRSASPARSTRVQSTSSPNQLEIAPKSKSTENVPIPAVPSHKPLGMHAGISIPNPLHNSADVELFSVGRFGKTEVLYKIIQTEIRYGVDESNTPYCILGFSLQRGEDKKRCLEVKLKGTFAQNRYKKVTVKHLQHLPVKENKLREVQIQKTSSGQGQLQVGYNGKPVALVTISGLKTTQYTVMEGQRIVPLFDESGGTFSLTLTLDDEVEENSKLPVAESVFFVMVLKLETERQSMLLDLTADIRYASAKRFSFGSKSKVVSNRFGHGYSGRPSLDIIKS